jgi:hypothetical protein
MFKSHLNQVIHTGFEGESPKNGKSLVWVSIWMPTWSNFLSRKIVGLRQSCKKFWERYRVAGMSVWLVGLICPLLPIYSHRPERWPWFCGYQSPDLRFLSRALALFNCLFNQKISASAVDGIKICHESTQTQFYIKVPRNSCKTFTSNFGCISAFFQGDDVPRRACGHLH